MHDIKHIVFALYGTLISFISPVHNAVKVLIFLCIANFLCGLLAGFIRNHEKFQFKKALGCLIEVAIYVVIVLSVYHIGDYMHDNMEAVHVVKVVTYIMICFYIENILRNLKILFPLNPVFAFLHYLIALEFVKRFPTYSEFLKKRSKK